MVSATQIFPSGSNSLIEFLSSLIYTRSSNLQLSPSTISTTENFTVTVTVQNTGSLAGKEVVQVGCTTIGSMIRSLY